MRRVISPALAAAALIAAPSLVLVACGKDTPAAAAAPAASAPKTVADYFPIKVGDKTVRMQLAVRNDEMQRGLMERRDLGRDDGMIFVYEKPQQMGFWMHNTPTALDIGFFGSNGVLERAFATPHEYFGKSRQSRRVRSQASAATVIEGITVPPLLY